jgi:transcription elongation factor GreA
MEDSMEKVPMTTTGHAALTEEYRRRTAEERRRIIDAISEARAHGDLSENAEYHAAKEQQSLNEGRIQELESLLALAEIIDVKKLSGSTVKFGATVTIVDEDTDEERAYQIVGDPEADASAGRISVSSPLARSMIGKAVGDSFEVSAPGGARSYEILDIKYA